MQDDELGALDAYWRAANYLTVGQIFLTTNALLREPLRPEHIKPHLLGHWGTSERLCTRPAPVVFAFHGYQRAVHELVHARANVERFHVRRFNEEGTTMTPFDMVVKNGMRLTD